MKLLLILALGVSLVVSFGSKERLRPTDPMLVFHKKGTIWEKARFGFMKLMLVNMNDLYPMADTVVRGRLKTLVDQLKVKKVEINKEEDHVVRIIEKKKNTDEHIENMMADVKLAFYENILTSLQEREKIDIAIHGKFTYNEGLAVLKKKMVGYRPLFEASIQFFDTYVLSVKKGKIEIIIQVPFVKEGDDGLQLITRVNVPIIYRDQVFGQMDPDYKILQNRKTNEYSVMSNQQYKKCKFTTLVNLLCREEFEGKDGMPPLEETCDGALFLRNFDKARKSCLPNFIQPHFFTADISIDGRNEQLVYNPKPVIATMLCDHQFVKNVHLEKLQIVYVPHDCAIASLEEDYQLIHPDFLTMANTGKHILPRISTTDIETMWPELKKSNFKKMVGNDDNDRVIMIDANEKNTTFSFVVDKKDEF